MNREDDDIEPLGAIEQAPLDGWLKIESLTIKDRQVCLSR